MSTTANPETSSNPFDTYDLSINVTQATPIEPPLLKSFLSPPFHENSQTTTSIFTVQKQGTSIDNEDNTQNIIMNHLHSVKSLKKFFETKMVIQGPIPSGQTASISQSIPANDEQKPIDEFEQRQEMMNKVLASLKKKKVYSRTTNGKIVLSLS